MRYFSPAKELERSDLVEKPATSDLGDIDSPCSGGESIDKSSSLVCILFVE